MSSKITARTGILSGTPTLFAPEVVEALDGTGLISAADANVGFNVRFQTGQFSDDGDWVRIERQDLSLPLPNWITIYIAQFTLPPTGDSIPVFISAPSQTGGFTHGNYQLRYQLYVNQFADPGVPGDVDRPGDMGEFSTPSNLRVDRIAPYANAGGRVQPPTAQYTGTLPPGAPITATSLAADGGLPFTIPANTYPTPSGQWAVGDTCKFYWSQSLFPRDEDEVDPQTPPRPFPATGTTFTVPPSAVSGSGPWYFFYTLTDQAGNVSRPSIVSSFLVSLLPAPVLLPIEFPLAVLPDNLLNINDWLAGIEAHVVRYVNHEPTLDQIQLQWGSQPWTALSPLFTSFPQIMTLALLRPLIIAEYGTAVGRVPTVVRYRVVRNGEIFNSPDRSVDVDLSVRGPVNPGDPGSTNPNLNAAQIFGAGSNEVNTLRLVHANQPVTVSIIAWSGEESPRPGQFIVVTGPDGAPILPGHAITTEIPGGPITFTVPWAPFAVLGNGPQTVGYFVSSSATPTADDNRNTAPSTDINIIDAVTLALAPPQFQRTVGAGANAQWTCDSLGPRPQSTPANYDGFIFVPGDSRMIQGQELTLSLRIFRPRTGTPVSDLAESQSVTVTPAIIASGHTFRFPFTLIRTAQLGRGEAISSTPLAGGVIGRGVTSINVRSVLSQTSCDLTPP